MDKSSSLEVNNNNNKSKESNDNHEVNHILIYSSDEKVPDPSISLDQVDMGSSEMTKIGQNNLQAEKVMDCAVCETRISVDFGQVSINGDFFCVQCITHANNVF